MATTPVIRFTGLVSGIDFDQVVEAMIEVKRQPILRLQEQRDKLRLQNELWREIQQKLSDLQNAVSSLLRKSQALPFSATSSAPDLLRVTANANAIAGSYQVTVKQIATSTRVSSGFNGYNLGIGSVVDINATLQSQRSILGTVTSGNFSINGVQINIDPTTDTLNDIINSINSSGTGVTASYDAATDTIVLSSSNPIALGSPNDTSNFLQVTGLLGSSQTFDGSNYVRQSTAHLGRMRANVPLQNDNLRVTLSQTTGSFTINGVTITYDASVDSLNTIVQRINQSVPDVQAYYDPMTDKVVLVSKTTGSNSIARSDLSGNLLDALGLLDNSANSRPQVNLGKDAIIQVSGFNNGQDIVRSSNTIGDVIPGITLQLLGADPSKTVTVTIGQDKTALKNAVKNFVDKFNAAVSLMYQRLTEKPIENPKTDSDKKIGLLRADNTLVFLRSTLVSEVTTPVSSLPSDLQILAQVGLRLNNDGTLSIDEAKLQAAIESDPEKVFRLFFNDANGNNVIDENEDGIAVRLKRNLDDWLSSSPINFAGNSVPKGIVARQPSLLNLRMQNIDRRINELNQRLEREEERLRRQFIALEQQIAYLSQRLGAQVIGLNRQV
ncbi:MAG: flagellar filament capping protein FliD [Armatimonadetes bacterium]|nr:flagellar filament capping protein FliD [Armatimonadota bacterium]MDW8027482.1 flagellar filament capping protein FliD [Armatimonadota bacterium]